MLDKAQRIAAVSLGCAGGAASYTVLVIGRPAKQAALDALLWRPPAPGAGP